MWKHINAVSKKVVTYVRERYVSLRPPRPPRPAPPPRAAVARARDHGRAGVKLSAVRSSPGVRVQPNGTSEAEQASVDGEAGAGAAGDGFLDKTVSPPVRRRPQAA